MTIDHAFEVIVQACDPVFARFEYTLMNNPEPSWLSGRRCQLYQGSIPDVEYWRLSPEDRSNFIVLEMITAAYLPNNVCWVDVWPARPNWENVSEQELAQLAAECQTELAAWLSA